MYAICHLAKLPVSASGRAAKKRQVEKMYMELVDAYRGDPVLGAYMEKLERALPNAFWFVLDLRIPPTSNYAERSLRELIVRRKIRGYVKSEDALRWMGFLFSCWTAWKAQKLDFREQMLQYV